MRTAEDIKKQVEQSGCGFWMYTRCTKCDTPIGYLFGYEGHEVVTDSSCECISTPPRNTTWDVVARQYNATSDKSQADIALGFASPKKVLMK